MAKRIAKSELIGAGCVIQGVGVLLFVAMAIVSVLAGFGATGIVLGLIAFIICLVIGSAKSRKYSCGNCGNPLANNGVRICPVCGTEFADPVRYV